MRTNWNPHRFLIVSTSPASILGLTRGEKLETLSVKLAQEIRKLKEKIQRELEQVQAVATSPPSPRQTQTRRASTSIPTWMGYKYLH